MKIKRASRSLALFLTAAIALPSSAGAGPELGRRTLRPTGLEEQEVDGQPARAKQQIIAALTAPAVPIAGLEETRGILVSGQKLTSQEERLIGRVVNGIVGASLRGRVLEKKIDLSERKYRLLDPGRVLEQRGVGISLLPGLNQAIKKLLRRSASPLVREPLLAYLRIQRDAQTQGVARHLYFDEEEAKWLQGLPKDLRRDWASYLAIQLDELEHTRTHTLQTQPAEETSIAQSAPAEPPSPQLPAPLVPAQPSVISEEVLRNLKDQRPENRLPMVVREAMLASKELSPPEQRRLVRLIEQGDRKPGEVAAALREAPKLGVPALRLLDMARRHGFTVPMEVEIRQVARQKRTGVGNVARWAKMVLAAERGKGPQDKNRERLWKTASLEVQREALQTSYRLLDLWKYYKEDHQAIEEVSFEDFLRLYYLVRDEDRFDEVVEALASPPLTYFEKGMRFPYHGRFKLAIKDLRNGQKRGGDIGAAVEKLEQYFYERGQRAQFQQLRVDEVFREIYGMVGVVPRELRFEGDASGLEELATLTATGRALELDERKIVRDAISDSPYAILASSDADLIDPWRTLRQEGGVSIAHVDFLSEMIRNAAQERRRTFSDFVLAFPMAVQGRPTLFVDSSVLGAIRSLPEKERASVVRQLFLQTSQTPTAIPEEGGIPPGRVEALIKLHRASPRALTRPIDPKLGMNIRKRTRLGRHAPVQRIISDVWLGRGFREDLRETLEDFAAAWNLSPPSRMEPRVRAILGGLERYLGFPPDVRVNLTGFQKVPLTLEGRELTIDASLLALPRREIRAVLTYSLDHMDRANRVAMDDPYGREFVAYIEGTQTLLELPPQQRRTLLSGLSRLYHLGWRTQMHIRYLRAVDRALNDHTIHRRLSASSRVPKDRERRLQREMAFRNAVRNRLVVQVRGRSIFLPEKILSSAYQGIRRETVFKGVPHHKEYLLPTLEEVLRFQSINPELTYEQAWAMATANPWLLLETRLDGWQRVEPILLLSLLLNPRENALWDLWKGKKSEIFQGRILRTRVKERDLAQMPYDAEMIKTLHLLVGTSGVHRLLGPLGRDERIAFVSGVGNALLGENLRRFREGVEQGQWTDGISYLLKKEDPERIVELLNGVQGVPLEGFWLKGEQVRQAKDDLMRVLMRRWGVGLGISLRTGLQPPVGNLIEHFLKETRIAAADAEREILAMSADDSGQVPQLLEATLRLKAQVRQRASQRFLARARQRLRSDFPTILTVAPADPSDSYALGRGAFHYLMTAQDPATLQMVARSIAQQVEAPGAVPAHLYPYARRVVRTMAQVPAETFTENLEAVQGITRYLYEENFAEDQELRAQKTQGFLRVMSRYPAQVRERVVAGLARNQGEFISILGKSSDPQLKTFLLTNTPLPTIAQHLGNLDLDRVRNLLAGVDSPLMGPILKGMNRYKARDILYRKVYEQVLAQFPSEVGDQLTGQRVPNYYARLGIPRERDPERLKAAAKDSYRKLAWAYHPDRFEQEDRTHRDQAADMMKKIMEAYEVLTDDVKRAQYDDGTNLPNESHLYPLSPPNGFGSWHQHPEIREVEAILSAPAEGNTAGLEEAGVVLTDSDSGEVFEVPPAGIAVDGYTAPSGSVLPDRLIEAGLAAPGEPRLLVPVARRMEDGLHLYVQRGLLEEGLVSTLRSRGIAVDEFMLSEVDALEVNPQESNVFIASVQHDSGLEGRMRRYGSVLVNLYGSTGAARPKTLTALATLIRVARRFDGLLRVEGITADEVRGLASLALAA